MSPQTASTRLVRTSNGLLFLAAVVIIVGLIAETPVVWYVGIALLVVAVVLAMVNSAQRRRRRVNR